MTKAVITIEDVGANSASFALSFEGEEELKGPASYAMFLAAGIRAMFDSGMLEEVTSVVIEAIEAGTSPAEAVQNRFTRVDYL